MVVVSLDGVGGGFFLLRFFPARLVCRVMAEATRMALENEIELLPAYVWY
jgi:hypothetical protein